MVFRRKYCVILVVITFQAVFSAQASAGVISILNPSFEQPGVDGSFTEEFGEFFTDRVISGWQGSGQFGFSEGVLKAKQGVSYSGITATDGEQVAYSNGGVISQVLNDVLETNHRYTLSVDVGNRLGAEFAYRIGLYAGGNLLVEDFSSIVPIDGEFAMSTISYLASDSDPNLGGNLEIRLVSSFAPTLEQWVAQGALQAQFDNVRLSAQAVPEPSALLAWALGLMGMTLVRNSRRSKGIL